MTDGAANSTTPAVNYESEIVWKNPYLMGFLAITIIAALPTLVSIVFVCRQPHLFNYWSLFLVEMAVGSLTTEAVVHLIPALVLPEKSAEPGVPAYFPYLATVSALVCVLHALDTASVVFFGRRQSASHAMEWREANVEAAVHIQAKHNSVSQTASIDTPQRQFEGISESSLDDAIDNKFYCREEVASNDGKEDETLAVEAGGGSDRGSVHSAVPTPSNGRDNSDITVCQALRNPGMCLRQGPYRLCSILSAGSVLHSLAHGMAIGAAYVKKWDYGLHLSVSVGLHELAHKVADCTVLTASGFSMKAVLLLNACYYFSNLVGLLASVTMSLKSDKLRAWITTVATAVFVYISLVTMSSMVRRNYNPRNMPAFFIGNVGMTVGYLLIMLASLLEFYV